jgi:hypothetical protein
MFILDSLMISGLRWTLQTIATAADTERNDDTALREQLLEAEMRREIGEISDEAFLALEADLLARMRDIRARRDGAPGPLVLAAPGASSGERVRVEATLTGDFHDTKATPPASPSGQRAPSVPPTRASAEPATGGRGRRRRRP